MSLSECALARLGRVNHQGAGDAEALAFKSGTDGGFDGEGVCAACNQGRSSTMAGMDPTVARLETPEECEQFALNVAAEFPELAQQARRRSVELRAAAYGAKTEAERDVMRVIYAYEDALFAKHGKRVKATYLRRKIEKDGLISAVEHAVNQPHDPSGYTTLKEMGLQDLTFEAVVLRHPQAFSAGAVERAKKRLRELAE